MKILMLAQFYPPVVGGEEHAVRSLSVELARRGHDVVVATIAQGGPPAASSDDPGVRVHRLASASARLPALYEGDRRHAPPLPDPELLWRLRCVIREERPDVVHAHNWIVKSYLPLARTSRAPLVLSLHDYSLICSTKRLMRHGRRCDGPGLRKCLDCAAHHYGRAKGVLTAGAVLALHRPEVARIDAFLPVSTAVAEQTRLAQQGLPYRVIPNFVPPAAMAAAARDEPGGQEAAELPRLPPGEFLLYIGDVSADKGVDVLLRALAELPRPVPLVIIGRAIDDMPLAGVPAEVQVMGALPHAGVLAVVKRCAGVVVPSVWREPAGLVALEAMAMGKPVVAARIGGLQDIVAHEDTGLLVEPGDVHALAAALARLLDDAPLRARLGAAGRRRVVERFSADVVVPLHEEAYHAVLKQRRAMRGRAW
jgi:glycosyltransferase involved in cell wall biosynthesis